LDWTKRFSSIAAALDIPGEAIIDGEIVVVHDMRSSGGDALTNSAK
jgi:bifunctional non-homologous end joining protein LigD